MPYPVGRSQQLPRAIHEGVWRIAARLGTHVAGDDLFLLALMELPPDTPARQALETEGADGQRMEVQIRERQEAGLADEPSGLHFPPAYNAMAGRAEAFAATLGDGRITPEHVLMALVWDPTGLASQVLWSLGVSRERSIGHLSALGIEVPNTPIPEQSEIEAGERVWFDRADLDVVLREIPLMVPTGTYWGFNVEDDRAWVLAEDTVDLRGLVDEVLAGR